MDPEAADVQVVGSTSSSTVTSGAAFPQPRIDTALRQQAHIAYRKLIKTAYIIAASSQPLSSFRTNVQIQKANGVQLIERYDTTDKCKIFVSYIADAIRLKINNILENATAFSVLSDGSQARKTSSEKELVMVRTVKNGAPAYFVASLQNVDDYGDASAINLKKCIDDTFKNVLKMSEERYTKLLVSATADGASVNTGQYNGLLVRLQNEERPWLVKIACISHRVELAIKDSLLKEKAINEVKDLMTTLYYLKKASGKFDRHFRTTASVLGVQVYKWPKVHGTRFVDHNRKGLRILLHNWLPLMIAIENSIANNEHRTISAKLRGILKKLTNMTFLGTACLFKLMLDVVAQLSLKFEEAGIQPFEVSHAVELAQIKLEELLEGNDSPLGKVDKPINTREVEGVFKINIDLQKPGHMRRLPENREYVNVSYDRMTHVGTQSSQIVENLKARIIPVIMQCLKERMKPFLEEEIFKSMLWVDPANWSADISVELTAMQTLADHFATTLQFHGFESGNLKKEWKTFKVLVKHYYNGFKARDLWANILQYRHKEFPNICLLVGTIFAVGISNCTVESGFSYLTAMLTDRRLSMKHETMDELLLIRGNHLVWSEKEREEILDCALNNFMQKRRKLKLSTNPDDHDDAEEISQPKKSRQESDDLSSESDSDSGSESDYTDHDVDSDVETLLVSWHNEDSASGSDSESNVVVDIQSKDPDVALPIISMSAGINPDSTGDPVEEGTSPPTAAAPAAMEALAE